ncbi:MAG: porin [Polyangiaceae bacterium]|nr:porin [Polyangiaceae bacterium]
MRLALTSAALGLAVTARAAAVEVYSDKDKGAALSIGVLIQPWLTVTSPNGKKQGTQGIGAPSGPDGKSERASVDTYLRRVRLVVSGNISKELSFFLDTDQPNWGKAGSFQGAGSGFSSPFYVQDAFLSYELGPEAKVDAGMMLLPFSHQTLEGAASLNTLDYHDDMVRFPTGKHFRDVGVQLRGLIEGRLLYRVGIFEGVRNGAALEAPVEPVGASYPNVNTKGQPRITGQLRANLLGSEPDFFFKGIYFASAPIVSIGVGGDYQSQAVLKLNKAPGRYYGINVDAFVEYPFSKDHELLAKVAFARFSEGWSRIEESTALETGGITAFGELGFRYHAVEPLVYVEYLRAKSDRTAPITTRPHASLATHVGVNYFVDQHRFNLKLDAGYRELQQENRGNNQTLRPVTYTDLLATLQGQVSF